MLAVAVALIGCTTPTSTETPVRKRVARSAVAPAVVQEISDPGAPRAWLGTYTPLGGSPAKAVYLEWLGSANDSYRVQVSADLLTWQTVGTGIGAESSYPMTNTVVIVDGILDLVPGRFYRVVRVSGPESTP